MLLVTSNVGTTGRFIAAAALVFAGNAPTVLQNQIISVPAGTITATGNAPQAQGTLQQAAGPLLLFGLNLGVSAYSPLAGAGTFTGYAPSVISIIEMVPMDTLESGASSISGSGVIVIPTGDPVPHPAAGTGTFAGHAPALNLTIPASAGSGSFAGNVPELTLFQPSAGSATFAGYAPSLFYVPPNLFPLTGAGTFAGYAPTLIVNATPGAGSGSFASTSPRLCDTFPMTAGTGTFAGYAPYIVSTGDLETGSGAVQSRVSTLSGDGVRVFGFTAAVASQRGQVAGSMVNVRVGSGAIQSGICGVNSLPSGGSGILHSGDCSLWGGGIVFAGVTPTVTTVNVESAQSVTISLSHNTLETRIECVPTMTLDITNDQ